jgi:hypothetical protein
MNTPEAPAARPRVKWLNRNVVGIGIADLAADANYEMVFAVLPQATLLWARPPDRRTT